MLEISYKTLYITNRKSSYFTSIKFAIDIPKAIRSENILK